jgi:hypothetical protein
VTSDEGRAPGRRVSWLIGCVVIAWLVVYNAYRLSGSTPRNAAWPSLGIGVAVGLVVFGLGLLAVRRLAASGRVVAPTPVETPSPSALNDEQRRALGIAWPVLGIFAVVAVVFGIVLLVDWLGAEGPRGSSKLILAGWDILIGLWVADETLRLRRGEADGVESLVLACALTALLAGVGLSRDMYGPGQALLIVLAGAAGGVIGHAVWRLQGSRGLPLGAIVAVMVALGSLIIPLAS